MAKYRIYKREKIAKSFFSKEKAIEENYVPQILNVEGHWEHLYVSGDSRIEYSSAEHAKKTITEDVRRKNIINSYEVVYQFPEK